MRIAIVGAGFAGLAAAWHLKNKYVSSTITLFDRHGIGGGASGVAAGLLHPFAGLHSKLNWRGIEGMRAAEKLLTIAQQESEEEIFSKKGMLRLALTDPQERDFARAASKYEEVQWIEALSCEKLISGIPQKPGIFIPSAISVHCGRYLKGLFRACQKKGVTLEKISIEHLSDLKDFDLTILATGAEKKLHNLPVTPVKGQILTYQWPEGKKPLPFALSSQAYLIMDPSLNSCHAGSTFEHQFHSEKPDFEAAKTEIQPKVSALYPALSCERIIDCKAALRASTKNHLPLLHPINAKTWGFTGLGSKGLLYHALLAEELSSMIN